ncbi:MAG: hypothetical protein Q9174_004982 [Haloplaca sp. 1 TL-2023]
MTTAFGLQPGGIKAEATDPTQNAASPHVKLEPPSAAASPGAHSDENFSEDAEELDFSGAQQGLFLTRIPKFLWEKWSTLDDDQEIELGTVRVEGGMDDVKRMSLNLLPHLPAHKMVPREYNMHLINQASLNTYVFTEKDTQGYVGKNQKGPSNGAGRGAFPSRPPKPWFQNRPPRNPDGKDKHHPYRRTIPKQTALVGQVQTEINCLPVENAEYKRTMDARAKVEMSKPRRQTKQIDGTEGSMYTTGTLGQSNAFETGFTSKKTKPKGQRLKAARMPANELKDQIFQCFKQHKYWALRTMRAVVDQPEAYLKQQLEEVAIMHRSGPFNNYWSLKSSYDEGTYNDTLADVAPKREGEDLASSDEEEVKMEDVSMT